MKIKVDQLKCDTSGICVKYYPELFRFLEGSKKVQVMEEDLPFYLEPEYIDIIALCPTGAISIKE